jgi:predicted ATP-dependent serine protease
MSAQDLVDNTNSEDLLEFSGVYKELFGTPSRTFDLGLSGDSGSGKTTFLLKFAYYLAKNFGKVLYISSEEFGSVTLVSKLEDMFGGKEGEDFKLPENLYFAKGMTDLTDYKFVIVDSITDMDLEIHDYKELRDIYKNTAFILVLQYTKGGEYKGGKEWEHECEIFTDVADGVITVTKNRYGVYGAYDFFNNEMVKKIETKDE